MVSLCNRAGYAATMGYSDALPTEGPCIYCGAMDGVVDCGGWRPDLDGQRCADRSACYERRTLQAASDAHFGSSTAMPRVAVELPVAEQNARAAYVIHEHAEAFTWAEAVGGLQGEAFPELAPKNPKTGRIKPVQTALF